MNTHNNLVRLDESWLQTMQITLLEQSPGIMWKLFAMWKFILSFFFFLKFVFRGTRILQCDCKGFNFSWKHIRLHDDKKITVLSRSWLFQLLTFGIWLVIVHSQSIEATSKNCEIKFEITISKLKSEMSEKDIHLKENLRDFQLTLPDNFKCSLCPAKFRYRINLNFHYKNVHQKVKCDECDAYMAQTNLAQHKLRHLKGTTKSDAPVGQHKCDQCEKTFTSPHGVYLHKKYIHEGEQKVCDGCFKTFKNQNSFRKHVCAESRENKQQKLQEKKKNCQRPLVHLSHGKFSKWIWLCQSFID